MGFLPLKNISDISLCPQRPQRLFGGFFPSTNLSSATLRVDVALSSQPLRVTLKLSNFAAYGLMSSSGVPSSMSTSAMRRMFFSIPSTPSRRTAEMPIGLGRDGARVAKSPRGVSSRNGLTVSFAGPARSNQ